MAAAEPLLLSKLCSICSDNAPKYTCPRCQSRTCSLSCSKRHKLWAQCSGKRDPASFVTKNRLVTPAGLNHDFNYLTGVERLLNASDERHSNDESSLRNGRAANLRRRFAQLGIRVQYAPKGMSRQKQNNTRWHDKLKCIRWTVEWVHPDGSRELRHCRDNISVLSNYKQISRGSAHAGPKHEATTPTEQSVRDNSSCAKTELNFSRNGKATVAQRRPVADSLETDIGLDHRVAVESEDELGTATPASHGTLSSWTENEQALLKDTHEDLKPNNNVSRGGFRHHHPRKPSNTHFYLVKPNTSSSKQTILIPIDPEKALSLNLAGQVVLEFPTLQVLEVGPSELPEAFQLERDYLKQMRRRIQEVDDELGNFEIPTSNSSAVLGSDFLDDQVPVTNERVIESLQKDLSSINNKA